MSASVRNADPADLDLLMSLVARLESELPPLPYPEDPAEFERGKVEKMIREGVALVAEDDGRAVGYALARFGDHGPTTVYVSDLWVDESHRGRGVGRDLLTRIAAQAAERGSTHIVLDVDSKNAAAIAFYLRLGFEEGAKIFRIGVEELTREHSEGGASFGAVHVQTDNAQAVQAAMEQYLPRLARGVEAVVEGGRGWTSVRLSPFASDLARKVGLELSERFGVTLVLAVEQDAVVRFVVHDRGRMVDEYLSVPDYYGTMPPGDALALRANPTVIARLTGADPSRIRAVARTARGVGELPHARQLYEELAAVLGVSA
jgi:ribosomal protein S18 acetylase RimI-like enzyme